MQIFSYSYAQAIVQVQMPETAIYFSIAKIVNFIFIYMFSTVLFLMVILLTTTINAFVFGPKHG